MTEISSPKSRHFRFPDALSIGALGLASALLLPIVAVCWIALFPTDNIWPQLWSTVLPGYVLNTVSLMAVVTAGAVTIGTLCAWLVVTAEFPGRRWLEWALLAPLAVPAYIGAYALVDLLEYAGPVQTALRDLFGWRNSRDYWFPEIRSFGSAAVVLSLVLYPYVYLLARAAFREQSVCVLDVARSLGCGPVGRFFRVGLPLARPSIAAGGAIVAMETMADFGTVDFFAVQTLTRGVFTVWLDMNNTGGAAQIAVMMLAFVMLLLVLERTGRRGRYHNSGGRYRPIERLQPRGWRRWALTAICASPVLLGFVVPVGTILSHALDDVSVWSDPAFWHAVRRTAMLAGAAAGIACLVGVLMVYGARGSGLGIVSWAAQATALGYAVPGAVVAVGVLTPFALFDNWLADRVEDATGLDIGLIFTGSAAALVFAYVVRFSAIAHGAIDGAFGRITPSMEYAARTLGASRLTVLGQVHVPMIKGSVLTAALLIFVDSAKELPATLILRPFNFETLSTTVYNAASLEQLGKASPPAIAIIVLGMIPVAILAGSLNRTRPGER